MVSVRSSGSYLKGRDLISWRRVADKAFAGNTNYIPSSMYIREGEEREFFFMEDGDKPVGRACVTIDKVWIERKMENIGFIDDFILVPGYEDDAKMLIDPCLSSIKDKGLDGVYLRNNGFPALLSEGYEQLPPAQLPYNPPSYIDLFTNYGFEKRAEWSNMRVKLPSLNREDIEAGEKRLEDANIKITLLNLKDKKAVKEYSDLLNRVFITHFGFNPREFISSYDTTKKRALARFSARLSKLRIYVGYEDKKMIFYFSFFSDMNQYYKSLRDNGKNPFGLGSLLRLIFRGPKNVDRARIGSLGIDEGFRGIGLISDILGYGLGWMTEDGYKEFDTGIVSDENMPVFKIIEKISRDWGVKEITYMKYYTLAYMFS
ncbi:MAG TPA: hypothetical protein HA341_04570 [Halobacteria archaeon]|jgi:hypothetical protein|nr:hypothetical protein [Halobacteria archaeon]